MLIGVTYDDEDEEEEEDCICIPPITWIVEQFSHAKLTDLTMGNYAQCANRQDASPANRLDSAKIVE